MKFKVNYGDKDKSILCTAKDPQAVVDIFDKKGRSINWIKDDSGLTVAERLKPTVLTTKNGLKETKCKKKHMKLK
jgi:hypothetical protein